MKYFIYVDRIDAFVEVNRSDFHIFILSYLRRTFKEAETNTTKYVFWFENEDQESNHPVAYTEVFVLKETGTNEWN